MPKVLKLIHPTLGVCAEVLTNGKNDEWEIKKGWKHKYGRKINECTISVVDISKEKPIEGKMVRYIKTGEFYQSITSASKATGDSKWIIYEHCHKKLPEGIRYDYEFV